MTTIEGNKLIANFNCDTPSFDTYYNKDLKCHFTIDEAEYHFSWDWLMPVIKKIKDYLNGLPRPSKNSCCKGDLLEVDIQCHLWQLDITKTHEACILFINWYNKQTLNP